MRCYRELSLDHRVVIQLGHKHGEMMRTIGPRLGRAAAGN
ncbi:helix-turn-helix domain-containing protein [Asaia sp. As-1742]|nr:helix-turn-helix domain-containing protein [Asaia sp. As-1742]